MQKHSEGEKRVNEANSERIGVSGSSSSWTQADWEKAVELGKAIAEKGFVLVTGACPGLPHAAAQGAKQAGGHSIGVSPAENLKQHIEGYKYPDKEFDEMVFTGFGWTLRNCLFVRNCDAVVFVGGGVGTLQEFTMAFQEGKVIGVLEGTRGISGRFRELVPEMDEAKRFNPKIVYSESPRELVQKIAEELLGRQ